MRRIDGELHIERAFPQFVQQIEKTKKNSCLPPSQKKQIGETEFTEEGCICIGNTLESNCNLQILHLGLFRRILLSTQILIEFCFSSKEKNEIDDNGVRHISEGLSKNLGLEHVFLSPQLFCHSFFLIIFLN